MIAEQDDDRVFSRRTLFEGRQNPPDLMIDKRDARQVSLHAFS